MTGGICWWVTPKYENIYTYEKYCTEYELWKKGIPFTENEWTKYGKPTGKRESDGYNYLQKCKIYFLLCIKQYHVSKDLRKLLTKYYDNSFNVHYKK